MKKNREKKKNKYNENNLEEPLNQDMKLNINIINSDLDNNNNNNKVSFCSRLFFLWTLIIMKLSNKKKLRKTILRESALFTNKNEQENFNENKRILMRNLFF